MVVLRDDLIQKARDILTQTDGMCFFCTEDLLDSPHSNGGVVVWQGANAVIALHQACAQQLAAGLMEDARNLADSHDGVEE